MVVLPYRNPLLVAKSVATIDALSNGRFVLAVGTGYLKGEYRALGVDFDQRNDLFDEAIEAMRGVWTTDDFRYEGRNFNAPGQTVNPKPSRPIPIWVGGNSRLSRRRAATMADGWVPFPAPRGLASTARTVPLETLDDLRSMLEDLWRQAEAADRDPAQIHVSFTTLAGGSPADEDFNPEAHLEAPPRSGSPGRHLVHGPHAERLSVPRPRGATPLRRISDRPLSRLTLLVPRCTRVLW